VQYSEVAHIRKTDFPRQYRFLKPAPGAVLAFLIRGFFLGFLDFLRKLE